MGKSKINWCNKTWNVTGGCSKVSDGCRFCWAEKLTATRFNKKPRYDGLTKDDHWTGEIKLFEDRLEQPLHWKNPCRIFVNSQSDLFHEKVDIGFLTHVFDTIKQCPQHTFQILTKRPEQALKMMWGKHGKGWRYFGQGDYHSNVHFGVSVENQKTADERIPLLLQIPAAKRFVSIEPLLSEIDLTKWLDVNYITSYAKSKKREHNIQTGSNGRICDRRTGTDLEKGETGGTQIAVGLSANKKNDKKKAISCAGASPCLSTFLGDNPKRLNGESRERDEGRQSTKQFKDNDIFGTNATRNPNTEETQNIKPTRRKKRNGETDKSKCNNHTVKAQSGRIAKNDSKRLSNKISNDFSNLQKRNLDALNLVIVGCESGSNRRPCKIEWVRSIVEQCKAAGVKVFVKQLEISHIVKCFKYNTRRASKVEHDIKKFPEDLRVREI